MRKYKIILALTGLIGLGLITLISCKKDKEDETPTVTIPVVSTANVSNIASTTAVCGGTVTSAGGGTITERGVCWSTGPNASLSNSSATDGSTGTGTYITNLSGLTGGTTYYVRAYAKNSAGTAYGSEKSFTAAHVSDQAVTSAATDITINSATLNGTVNPNNTSTTVLFQYGTDSTYGSVVNPTPAVVNGNAIVSLNAPIASLNPGTQYHFRIVAENIFGGTEYGNDFVFTTLGTPPTVTTLAASNIFTTTAVLNGTVNPNWLPATVTFEYGTTTSYGQSVSYTYNPLSGSNPVNVSEGISGLSPHVLYHFRVKAQNDLGAVYGSDQTFTTLGEVPVATTAAASAVTAHTATLNGSVNAGNLSTTVTFEYGTSTSYGSTIAAQQNPINGDYNAPVSADITGLTSFTTYHLRIKAQNQLGTVYSQDMQFTTDHALGDYFGGGYIFYLEPGNQHGLICSDTDFGSSWGCQTEVPGAAGTAIGTGYQNTLDIVAANFCGTSFAMAGITCYDLTQNGYSDWFMPSIDEMSQMYTALKLNGIGNFTDEEYWSSTEYSARYAHYINMTDGTVAVVDFFSKETPRKVRPVRAF